MTFDSIYRPNISLGRTGNKWLKCKYFSFLRKGFFNKRKLVFLSFFFSDLHISKQLYNSSKIVSSKGPSRGHSVRMSKVDFRLTKNRDWRIFTTSRFSKRSQRQILKRHLTTIHYVVLHLVFTSKIKVENLKGRFQNLQRQDIRHL